MTAWSSGVGAKIAEASRRGVVVVVLILSILLARNRLVTAS